MSMEVSGVSTNNLSQNTVVTEKAATNESKLSEKQQEGSSSNRINDKDESQNTWNNSGVTYEKGNTDTNGLYNINKMNKADRSALVNQLKAEMESNKQKLMDLVHKTLSGQVETFGKASDDENSIWKTLAGGKFTVDAATKAQAKKDISEDGYWGVKQTSQRLFDFASALAGDDVDKMKEMQAAMEKGYKLATKAWGRELPSISKDTLNAANKLFEDYYRSKETNVDQTQI